MAKTGKSAIGTFTFEPTPEHFGVIEKWPMVRDPFAGANDYSPLKLWLRWLKPAHREAHRRYREVRAKWIEGGDFQDYFANVDRSISRTKWEYMKLRKSCYITPLNWERYAGEDCRRILDLCCGDGDQTQRLIDFIAAEWKRTGKGHDLEIVGVDLSASRINNAQKLVALSDPRIKVQFMVGNAVKGLPFPDGHFDYGFHTGVLEILDDDLTSALVRNFCKVVRKGIFVEDLLDLYPGGYPREDLGPVFQPCGFVVTKRIVALSEPFSLFRVPDPCRIWPIMLIQNIWVERIRD